MKQRLFFLLAAAALLAVCVVGFPSPVPPSPVYADWSHLTPYQPPEALYSTFEPFSGDRLTARDDYGPLQPYIGATANLTEYITDRMPLYGLMTAEGTVVTEPVYANIYLAGDYRGSKTDYAPFLILSVGCSYNDAASAGGSRWTYRSAKITVAAPDGRWVLESDYCSYTLLSKNCLVLMGADDSITVIDQTGAVTASIPRSAITPYLGEEYYWDGYDGDGNILDWVNGVGCVLPTWEERQNGDDAYCLYLNPADGSVSPQPPEGFSPEWGNGEWEEPPVFPGYRRANPQTDPATGRMYYSALRDGEDWIFDMLDESGRILLEDCDGSDYLFSAFVWNSLIATVQNDAFCYYDLDGNCVFRFPLRSNLD